MTKELNYNKPLFDSEHTDPNLIYNTRLTEAFSGGFWDNVKSDYDPNGSALGTNDELKADKDTYRDSLTNKHKITEKEQAVESLKSELEKMKSHMTIFFNHHDPKEHDDIVDCYNRLYGAVYAEWQRDQAGEEPKQSSGYSGSFWDNVH